MCGRFTLSTPGDTVAAQFGLPSAPALPPRYNVAPAQLVAVVGLKPDGRTRGLALLRWGFVPHWANDPNKGPRPVNAKAESVALKQPFKEAFRSKRCLIPADGFFEWKADGKRKQPYHFRPKDGGLFGLAGVWDAWKGASGPALLTCAIITMPANAVVKPVHERMPLILPPEAWGRWLDPSAKVADLLPLLKTPPADGMEAVAVGPAVNKVANDGPECLTPAA
jgi:putative SOS response-associated peptidase YedK